MSVEGLKKFSIENETSNFPKLRRFLDMGVRDDKWKGSKRDQDSGGTTDGVMTVPRHVLFCPRVIGSVMWLCYFNKFWNQHSSNMFVAGVWIRISCASENFESISSKNCLFQAS